MIEEPQNFLQPPYAPLAFPHVTMMQERLIGRVVVVWAKLEGMLNDLIWAIQGKAMADGRSDTERMQITPLIKTLRNLVNDILIPEGLSEESHKQQLFLTKLIISRTRET